MLHSNQDKNTLTKLYIKCHHHITKPNDYILISLPPLTLKPDILLKFPVNLPTQVASVFLTS